MPERYKSHVDDVVTKAVVSRCQKSGLTNFLAISDHFMKNLFSSHPSPDSLTDVTLACEDPATSPKVLLPCLTLKNLAKSNQLLRFGPSF